MFTEFAQTFLNRCDRIILALFFLFGIGVVFQTIWAFVAFAGVFVFWICGAELIMNSVRRFGWHKVWKDNDSWYVHRETKSRYLYFRLRGFHIYEIDIPYKVYCKHCKKTINQNFKATLISMNVYEADTEIRPEKYQKIIERPPVFIERWN
jgi:hypothetical protein